MSDTKEETASFVTEPMHIPADTPTTLFETINFFNCSVKSDIYYIYINYFGDFFPALVRGEGVLRLDRVDLGTAGSGWVRRKESLLCVDLGTAGSGWVRRKESLLCVDLGTAGSGWVRR